MQIEEYFIHMNARLVSPKYGQNRYCTSLIEQLFCIRIFRCGNEGQNYSSQIIQIYYYRCKIDGRFEKLMIGDFLTMQMSETRSSYRVFSTCQFLYITLM